MESLNREIRTRIGLIIPSSNVLTEPQFNAWAPPDVQVHVTRLRMTGENHVPVDELIPQIEGAGRTLVDARCQIIVFHCTASSTEAGIGGDRRIIEALERATGAIITTTARALVAAFEVLDLRRLVLVTPYVQKTNDHEISYFREAGFDVIADRALDLGSANYPFMRPEAWQAATEEAATPEADGYVLSCTNIRAPEVIEPLEQRLGKPVIGSNPATLWYALRLCGRDDVVPGIGTLMSKPPPRASAALV